VPSGEIWPPIGVLTLSRADRALIRSDQFLRLSTEELMPTTPPTRKQLIEALNEDLSREYQAIIAYVVYSQVLKGAEYMAIAKELEVHAKQELDHALKLSKHIDYLGGTPATTAKPVKISKSARDLLRFDLDNENETVRNYRERVKQCEALEEYAIAEDLREILRQEQEHQIDLATALGEDVPDVSKKSRKS
jgi:bacterioferritin